MADKKISDLPAAGAITGAELVPVVQGGVTSRTTASALGGASYLVYRALLTQASTDAPVAIILENTLSGVPVWSYNDVGYYFITLPGAFPRDKTFCLAQISDNGFVQTGSEYGLAPDTFYLYVTDPTATPTDGMLGNAPFEILVYN